jgi:hypothetical protein
MEKALEIQSQALSKILCSHFQQRAHSECFPPSRSRVVHENVDPAELIFDLLDHDLHFFGHSYVCKEAERFPATLSNLIYDWVSRQMQTFCSDSDRFGPSGNDSNICACIGQGKRNRLPDSLATTGHDRHSTR